MKPPVIEIKSLSKFYGATRGIDNVNLTVDEGKIFGFIGPNGAGKSTTIRILLNLIFPTGGSARIMGMDVTTEATKIKRFTGYVPSDANAYSNMDVNEFLTYCQRFYNTDDNGRIRDYADMFELDLHRRIGELSMGNRKKVAIIQSLIHNPQLLILDEPTTGLDPLMQARFFELLRSENRKGLTIFYSSHILSEIELLCKRVAIIRDGQIIKVEEIENLRKKQLKYVRIIFREDVHAEEYRIDGITSLNRQANSLSFMFSGNINELLSSIVKYQPDDLIIQEPSLEEIFMHYYE
jgi:ABC-2 type transport system ATP-binding protein